MVLRIQTSCLASFFKKIRSARFLFAVSCMIVCFCSVWALFGSSVALPIDKISKNISRDLKYAKISHKLIHDAKKLKYILLWTANNMAPLNFYESGQKSFIERKCEFTNCYVTSKRTLLGSDYTKFDAIAFNGRDMKKNKLPVRRSPQQKYIFFNMESSDNYPVCDDVFDGFFNMTATYKLNSDILLCYIMIKNNKGVHVGPKPHMQWYQNMTPVGEEFNDKIINKTKAVAWFVSHCKTRSKREDIAKQLNNAIKPYGYKVDTYGKCGNLNCSRGKKAECNLMLKKKYYFYLSFENSFAVDYVTEKILTALNNYVVPIVLGAGDYSRFLPPGSYINILKQDIHQTAAIIDKLIHSPEKYRQLFRWTKYYQFQDPYRNNVCNLCKALNDENLMKNTTIYHNFRAWWNPNYKKQCNIN